VDSTDNDMIESLLDRLSAAESNMKDHKDSTHV